MPTSPLVKRYFLFIIAATCLYAGESIYDMFGVANITVANRIEYPYYDATIAEITNYLLRLKQTSRSKCIQIVFIFPSVLQGYVIRITNTRRCI